MLVQRSLRLEALVIMAWTAARANLHAGLLVIPFRHLGTLPFCDDAPGTLAHHRMVFVFLGLPIRINRRMTLDLGRHASVVARGRHVRFTADGSSRAAIMPNVSEPLGGIRQ